METGSPTLNSIRLGRTLRELREKHGLRVDEVAHHVGIHRTTVSRIESGSVRRVKPRDLNAMLDLYEVSAPEERERLFALAAGARAVAWWDAYRKDLPAAYEQYIGMEAGASYLRAWQPLVVPGLLQTEDYARALIRGHGPDLTHEQVDQRVTVRLARQEILRRANPPRLWAILDEAALHRAVGGPTVTRAQLRQLIAASEAPNVTLQVVPYAAGAHPGTSGPFVIIDAAELDDTSVVYIETVVGDLYLQDTAEVQACKSQWEHLVARALSPEESVARVAAAAQQ